MVTLRGREIYRGRINTNKDYGLRTTQGNKGRKYVHQDKDTESIFVIDVKSF